jgi:hypothetical protein
MLIESGKRRPLILHEHPSHLGTGTSMIISINFHASKRRASTTSSLFSIRHLECFYKQDAGLLWIDYSLNFDSRNSNSFEWHGRDCHHNQNIMVNHFPDTIVPCADDCHCMQCSV